LSILGAPPARFQEYEAQVRSEYAWVPDEMFRSTRAEILKELLGRSHLYSTAYFQERYEARARRNLQHSFQSFAALGAQNQPGHRRSMSCSCIRRFTGTRGTPVVRASPRAPRCISSSRSAFRSTIAR